MRPLKLVMRAFGPYAEEQTIDFSLLGEHNFFLIHGPTGAGKSSILDAICFALYGSASGDLRDSRSLRSDYAPASRRTEVEFTFHNGGATYCVLRSPEQEITRQRGSGTRKLPSAAVLRRLNADGTELQLLAERTDEVTRAIIRIMGFKAEQFRQIVLLPQGEFRRFLIADSRDRKAILETVFKTQLYRAVEELLYARCKDIKTAYESCKKEREMLLQTCALESEADFRAKIAALEAEAAQCDAEAARQTLTLDLCRAQIAQAQSVADAFSELGDAQAKHARLSQLLPQMQEGERSLAAAEQAALLEEIYKTADRSLRQRQAAEAESADAAAKLAQARSHAAALALSLHTELDSFHEEDPEAAINRLNAEILRLTEENAALAGTGAHLVQLANELQDGVPCPVCGSVHHPRPASLTAREKQALAAQSAALQEKKARLQQAQQNYRQTSLLLAKLEATADAAKKHLAATQLAFDDARAAYAHKLRSSVFEGDQTAFLQSRLTPERRASLKAELDSYRQQLAIAAARYERAQKAVLGKTAPDMDALHREAKQQENSLAALTTRSALLRREAAELSGRAERLQEIERQLAALDTAQQTAATLAETARGNNAARLTFSGFVLQTILDKVLVAANLRLHKMSRGRYSLARAAAVADARRENGLNIEVTDTFTGVPRPVKTLSGGELFLASLSLALGLADVVQSEAGGTRLDTILIDEGFGSLDSEALDMAVSTLIDLQGSGRLVGIISHVAELRERIHTRLEVIPGQRGSRAVLHL